LKIKRLCDVFKALKIKELRHSPKLPQSHPKTTPKITPKAQTVENQALERFFCGFGVVSGKVSFLTLRPTQPTWHDFCTQDPTAQHPKTVENQALA
jgi:hypothetical protein